MRQTIQTLTAVLLAAATLHAQGGGWSAQISPTSRALYGVAFIDTSSCVVVGDAGSILRSSDGGTGWKAITSPVTDALRAVSFHGPVGLAVGIAGRVLRSTDAGLTWTSETRPTTKALYAVSMGDHLAVITGEEGGIFVSTDDGVTWGQHVAGTASVLFGVSVSGDVAVGVGGQGAVVMSDNRGAGWGLTILGTALTAFYGVSFPSAAIGWAVGTLPTGSGVILRSDASGFTWKSQASPATDILFGVSFVDTATGTAVGANGAIVHTVDGGRLWSTQVSGVTQTLNAVSFANTHLGLAVGNGGTILRTLAGGLTAVQEHAPRGGLREAALAQNYPNPFNPVTTIRYSLPQRARVRLTVFNALGQQVAELVNGEIDAGTHDIQFNAANLASGFYFYRLQSGNLTDTKRLLVLK